MGIVVRGRFGLLIRKDLLFDKDKVQRGYRQCGL